MRPSVDLAYPLARQVRVQLCGGDAGMPEQLLHHAQVGPAFQQVRGETMPQRVRSHMAPKSRPLGGALDDAPCLHPAQPPTPR